MGDIVEFTLEKIPQREEKKVASWPSLEKLALRAIREEVEKELAREPVEYLEKLVIENYKTQESDFTGNIHNSVKLRINGWTYRYEWEFSREDGEAKYNLPVGDIAQFIKEKAVQRQVYS